MPGAAHLTRLEERFGEAPAIEVARSGLRDVADRAWLVGGAVRDAILGGDVVDVDIAFDGDVEAAARQIAADGGGHPFELSDEFATWRVVAREGGWKVDIAALRAGSIELDLRLRDFTVNAVAVPLAGGIADRPDRRPGRPRGGCPAGLLGPLVRRRPAASAPGRAIRGPGRAGARAGDRRAGPPRGSPRRRTGGRAPVHRAGGAALRAGSARRARPARSSSRRPQPSCRRSRRCAGSSRAPTITSTSTTTRSRCCAGCSRSSVTCRGTAATRPTPWPGSWRSRWPTI